MGSPVTNAMQCNAMNKCDPKCINYTKTAMPVTTTMTD